MAMKRVLVNIDEDVLGALDKLAGELGMSRSRVLEGCIESTLDDFRWMAYLGVRPRHLRNVAAKLKRLKRLKSGAVEIDTERALKGIDSWMPEGAGQ